MKYHKEQMLKHGALFLLFLLLAIGVLGCFIYVVVDGGGGVAIVFLLLMVIFFGFLAWVNASSFSKANEGYKAVKDSGLLEILETINPYSTYNEMFSAFKNERENKLYEDSQICITDNFLGYGDFCVLTDGILDARVIVHKRNGLTEKVELSLLCYDGEKIKFDYCRPAGFSGSAVMQEQANNLEIALNLIAEKGKLFRKYDCCRL